MGQKYVSCREQSAPDAPMCNAMFTSSSEKELLEMAVRHGINSHGHANTEAYREEVRNRFMDGTPPE